MIKIAHRGNLDGPNPDKENHPDYLLAALSKGYHVEVDVWSIGEIYVLGHDKPQYEVSSNFLNNEKFWHHAKNIRALGKLLDQSDRDHIRCFFHDQDDYTLTSCGWIWVYPGKKLIRKHCVAVMPEKAPNWDLSLAGAVCSDYPNLY